MGANATATTLRLRLAPGERPTWTGSTRRRDEETNVYEEIIYEVDGPVAVITLNRPHAMNAWTDSMAKEFFGALDQAANDPEVVGIVLTGAGRAFCAGADMNTLSNLSSGGSSPITDGASSEERPAEADRSGSTEDDFGGLYTKVMAIPKPVIAAINGAVAGMAYALALACDIRYIAPEAPMLTAFAQRGLIAEWGLGWLLPRLVGPSVALDLLYSSRKVRGEEAVRIGLANEVVEADQVVERAKEYVRGLAATSSPASMAVMKRQVYEDLHVGLGAAERRAAALMLESFGRPDFAEGVKSFLEKRPPNFPRIGSNG
ncbi:MAG: enoyl-CoA hydratase-related protein [Ilumatobacteraceae bacterium]